MVELDAKIITIFLLGICLMYFLFGQLFPSQTKMIIQTSSAPSLRPASSLCSMDALVAKEDDHFEGYTLRKELIKKWAPEGSVFEWDAQMPLHTAGAWNAPTVWDIWAPTYGCGRPVHIGGLGGPAWGNSLPLESKAICSPQTMRKIPNCVVYSFGVGWDVTFETSILRIAPNCKVRVFDPTTTATKFWELVEKQTPANAIPPSTPALDFVGLGLAAETTDDYRIGSLWNNIESIKVSTLADIMKSQGDEQLTILKVDIEGSEWTALPQAAESGALAKVDQLLLEVHLGGCEAGYQENNRNKLDKLFEAIEGSGLRAFSNIPNLVPVSKGQYPGCAEYSFVHKNGPFVQKSCGT